MSAENKDTETLEKKSSFFSKAKSAFVNKIDQNGSGSLDKEDFGIIAGNIKDAAKKVASTVVDKGKDGSAKLSEMKREYKLEVDKRTLSPLFKEKVDSSDFTLPKMIQIETQDKRHAENDVCKGSIGHYNTKDDITVCTIYPEYLDEFSITLCPHRTNGIYYEDPVFHDKYIELDEYFDYLRVARTSELQKIAQDLGARYFKVSFKEEKTSITSNKIQSGIQASKKADIGLSTEHDTSNKDYTSVEVAAEMHFNGHEPRKPQLEYLANSPAIKSLIDMRMDDNALTHQTVSIKLSKIAGIKQNDAVKIDAALSMLKVKGNCSVSSQVQKEARTILEYEIEF